MYEYITGRTQQEVLDKLNGWLFGTANVPDEGLNLNGLTLVFTAPAATVTFSGGNPVSPADIVAQIDAQLGAGAAKFVYLQQGTPAGGRLPQRKRVLAVRDPADGTVTIDIATSTGEQLLGYTTANATKDFVAQTEIASEACDASGHHYVLVNR